MKNTLDILKNANTGNEFGYSNIEDIESCYKYYEKYAQNLINSLGPEKNLFNQKDEKKLEFVYRWEESVNAGSVEGDKWDEINFNEGAILKIYDLFYKINTRTTLIDTKEKIKSVTEIRRNVFFSNSNIKDSKVINTEMMLSDNKIINNISEYMAMFATKFLVAHEIGHIYNGHTEYYKSICEKIKNKNGDIESLYLDLQTMEMDADAFAINRMVDEVFRLSKSNDKIFSLLNNKIEIIKILEAAIHGVFYIFRDYDKDVNYKLRKHPSAYAREMMVLDAMKQAFMNHYKIDISHEFICKNVALIDEHLHSAEKSSNKQYKEYIIKFGPDVVEYTEILRENFMNKVNKIIKKDSRLPVENIDY